MAAKPFSKSAFRFYLRMVTSSLIRRRSRMAVALLAIAIGATILSGLITIYYDIPRQMGQEFRSYGANFLLYPSDSETLSDRTIQAARALLPEGTMGIAPYRYRMAKINEQPFMAAGTELTEARKTSPYWAVEGSWPETPNEALIGEEVAEHIRLAPGSAFALTVSGNGGKIQGSKDFIVSGVLRTGGAEEAFIFMSLEDFSLLGAEEGIAGGEGADVVECSINAPRETLEAAAHRINTEVDGIEARLVRRVTESEGAVLGKLQTLIYLVTIIVLLLTMICVATTMMAVVTERRKEIGLRKALGAANSSLVMEFLGEGIFLGGFGGALGGLLGFVFAQTVGLKVFNRAIAFNGLLLPATIFAAIIITGIACLIPLRSATKVDPAVVLRGE
ncbi:ABC transporter permease [Leadbettera azotonutricia]|uniref:Permease domain protein n=1 Tax=Leadbettera azotonutricia (strain ATCC BAA-888 / DSM 13862 / ZAS-9) TaxID=545695 RepID=F5YCI3_LEAAZ|nr:ABC transporter permease [Leadbettera azotonutricia]AEF83150.1 permease domain protein [Leadbettera azotonutricia ZAS-9]